MRIRGSSLVVASIVCTVAAVAAFDRRSESYATPKSPKAAKAPTGYTLTKMFALGDPAPGGGTFHAGGDIEPGEFNSKGQFSFVTELDDGEGMFIAGPKGIKQVLRPGTASPAGGTFSQIAGFHCSLNAKGEVGFYWYGGDYGTPNGHGASVFRWSNGKFSTAYTLGESAPGGGTFEGTAQHVDINARGDLVYDALVAGADIDPTTPPGAQGFGVGVFVTDRKGNITTIVRPGDAAPGGKVFDFAQNATINDLGDVAFGAHVVGDECLLPTDQSIRVFCGESVYVKRAKGGFESIAHQGDPASGGTFRLAFGPVINNAGDILFVGDLTPAPGYNQAVGIFLHHAGFNAAVVRPGDLMPGGGHVVNTTYAISNYDLNNKGDVAFCALLDTDDDHDGNADTGVYVRLAGSFAPLLVARTGTVVAGVGTIAHLQVTKDYVGLPTANAGPLLNDLSQIVFSAVLTDDTVVEFKGVPHR